MAYSNCEQSHHAILIEQQEILMCKVLTGEGVLNTRILRWAYPYRQTTICQILSYPPQKNKLVLLHCEAPKSRSCIAWKSTGCCFIQLTFLTHLLNANNAKLSSQKKNKKKIMRCSFHVRGKGSEKLEEVWSALDFLQNFIYYCLVIDYFA